VGAALIPGASLADTVVTSNGDTLNGRITGMRDGRLTLAAPYAEITIPWPEVRSASTDDSVVITLADGTKVIGTLNATSDGQLQVQPDGATSPVVFPVSVVTKIHPGDSPEAILKTSGFVNIGIKTTEGNTDTESYHADAEFVARTAANRYTVGTVLNYAEDDGDTTANDKRAYARYDHFVSQRWYINTNTSFLRDEFKDLRLRSTLGAGMGYQVLESDTATLSVELGGTYIRQDYQEGEDDSSIAARWALDYSQDLFNEGITLFHNHELLKGVGDEALFLAYTRTGVRFPLVSGLAGTAQVNYEYNDNPQGDRAYADTTYLLTLGYSF
jgi:putative salt-induced outer membrane protein YdiY